MSRNRGGPTGLPPDSRMARFPPSQGPPGPHYHRPPMAPAGPIPGPLERAIAAARPSAAASRQGPSSAAATRAPPGKHSASSSLTPAAAAPRSNSATVSPGKASSNSSASPSPPASPGKTRYKRRTKKYNNFNIFFMLERQLLLQSRGGGIDAIENPIDTSDSPLIKYKELRLPPLCRRYNHLPLTSNWFLELLANQNKKRPHRKSHGLIPFKELAQTVAKNYREIDDDTQSFVNEVAERLGWHCEEVEAMAIKEEGEENAKRAAASATDGKVASSSAGKKRKEAPVVSVARGGAAAAPGSLSRDEAATVQQLMGMKANSPHSAPSAGPPGAVPPAPLNPDGRAPLPPMMSYPPPPDAEAERLQFELARAMDSRRESERRIQYLKEQMTRHHVERAHQGRAAAATAVAHQAVAAAAAGAGVSPDVLRNLPPGYDRYLASVMTGPGGSGSSPPLTSRKSPGAPPSPRHHPPPPGAPGLHDLENELIKEALLRRILHPTQGPAPPSALGRLPLPPPSMGHPPLNRNRSGDVPLKKRQRFHVDEQENSGSRPGTAEEKRADESKEEAKDGRLPGNERPPSQDPERPAHPNDIGYYRDLYAELVAPRGGHPAAREMAYLDRVLGAHGGLNSSRSLDPATERILLERLAASRGIGGGRLPMPAYPPAASAPYPPQESSSSYAAFLSQLSAGAGAGGRHAGMRRDGPPSPRHGATSPPQQSLSYNEMLDHWKNLNNREGKEQKASNGVKKEDVEG
mmetsp:Transcript_13808/g.29401  ORF Transcript_13808/g.29401 Transcript_13808/m.29401 type:complete len:749 (-) Transcript_13808:256-2502(-)